MDVVVVERGIDSILVRVQDHHSVHRHRRRVPDTSKGLGRHPDDEGHGSGQVVGQVSGQDGDKDVLPAQGPDQLIEGLDDGREATQPAARHDDPPLVQDGCKGGNHDPERMDGVQQLRQVPVLGHGRQPVLVIHAPEGEGAQELF